jgi:uncharacterized protein (TIGR03435 family)
MTAQATQTAHFARQRGRDRAHNPIVAVTAVLAVLSAAAPEARAQSGDRFEVASVRRVDIPVISAGVPVFPVVGGIGTSTPHRITYRGTWLLPLIAEAFGVRADQITGPAWLRMERYDIVANIPDGATKDQFALMLGNLLRERFGLRFHVESQLRPVFALRVGKNGPKLEPTAREANGATPSSGSFGKPDARGCPNPPSDYQGMVSLPAQGEMCWTARDVPIKDLARLLERPAGRPVVDETGLTGRYDFKVHFEFGGRPVDAGVTVSSAPSVFAAVEEQLGLRLESASASFDSLVIDSIDREPTGN